MALIEFKNLPDTSTPLNAENLNNNFNELNNRCQQDITSNANPVKCGYKIDGKDVYVKKITGSISVSGITVIDSTLTTENIDLIRFDGNTKTPSGQYAYAVPWYESATNFLNISINDTDGLRIHAGSTMLDRSYSILVWFTYKN